MNSKQDLIALSRRPTSKMVVVALLSLIAAGAILHLVSLFSEFLLCPASAEPVARACYRVVYFIRFPAMFIARIAIPIDGKHETIPPMYDVLVSFAAPFVWTVIASLWFARRAAVRRRRNTKSPLSRLSAKIPRRAFLAGAATCVAGAGGLGGYAVLIEPQRLRIARYTIAIRDLPASLDGFRIVHVSDTHYGPFVSLSYIRGAIEQANALHGDLVVLTGDYVHRTPRSIGPGVDVLKHLKARLGVVATLGNHDHWEGADGVRAAFAEIGVPLIDNARRFVTRDALHDGPAIGQSICLGGVGDLWEDKTDFNRALADAPDTMPRVVLAHNPDTAEHVAAGTRIDLMCSGHTHGGQVWVPGLGTPIVPSAYGQKYAGGLCAGPQCPILVSRGVGMAIMPARFGVPPEIGEITLTKA